MKRAITSARALLLAGAAVLGLVAWEAFSPAGDSPLFAASKTERQIARLAQRDPRTGAAAWFELERLYQAGGRAQSVVLRHVHDPAPINFLMERRHPGLTGTEHPGFMASVRPIALADPASCKTVGEALMAIVYNSTDFETAYDGDWERWWKDNMARRTAR